jgi:hypothetical protein
MSPWTALLESLHSALIDELTERHPEPKPELGMPQRHKTLALPAPGKLSSVICEVTFVLAQPVAGSKETRGFALLAVDDACSAKLKLDARKLWDALIKRAGREFMFRGIQPRLGDVKELEGAAFPSGFAEPTRVIWIPFKLGGAACYLGVGA